MRTTVFKQISNTKSESQNSNIIKNQSTKILIKSFAKINWFLNVEKCRDDGYHSLQTVMQLINLYDNLSFELLPGNKIEIIETGLKSGCLPENNIVFYAAEKLQKIFNVKSGVRIIIEKKIPIGAGLGGGSANAATTLYVLNSLWNIGAQYGKLLMISAELGADVPFFFNASSKTESTAFCSGIGEKISPVLGRVFHIVLWNPGVHLSTADVYKKFDVEKRQEKSASFFFNAFLAANLNDVSDKIWNNLAFAAAECLPELAEMKRKCIQLGALNSWVTGSGPTVVSLCENKEKAEFLGEQLREFAPENHFIHVGKSIE